jgi:hypothetical protein
VREQFAQIKAKFGDEFMFHIEFGKWNGEISPGSIPIVRFTTEERLQEMIDYCEQIGVSVSNPHTCTLGSHGRHFSLDTRVGSKKEYDPKGLFNPGKIKGYPLPPGLTPLELSL